MIKKLMLAATLLILLSAAMVSAKQLVTTPKAFTACRGACSLGLACPSPQCRCILLPNGSGSCI